MTAAPDGLGYWLVGADGGIFAFGSAPFAGSGAGSDAARALGLIVPSGRAATYALVLANGTTTSFGG